MQNSFSYRKTLKIFSEIKLKNVVDKKNEVVYIYGIHKFKDQESNRINPIASWDRVEAQWKE